MRLDEEISKETAVRTEKGTEMALHSMITFVQIDIGRIFHVLGHVVENFLATCAFLPFRSMIL